MKKIEKTNFIKRLSPYNKPCGNVVIGIMFACVQGCIFPTFGILIMKVLFSLMIPDLEEMKDTSRRWCLYMFLCALTSLIAVFVMRFSFGVIGENITLNVRNSLYSAILKKNIGWFDSRENSAGIITAVLASEV